MLTFWYQKLSMLFQVEDFVTSRLWKLVKQLAAYLSGIDEWYPYDVSMNIIRNSHFPRIHQDCEHNEVKAISVARD